MRPCGRAAPWARRLARARLPSRCASAETRCAHPHAAEARPLPSPYGGECPMRVACATHGTQTGLVVRPKTRMQGRSARWHGACWTCTSCATSRCRAPSPRRRGSALLVLTRRALPARARWSASCETTSMTSSPAARTVTARCLASSSASSARYSPVVISAAAPSGSSAPDVVARAWFRSPARGAYAHHAPGAE